MRGAGELKGPSALAWLALSDQVAVADQINHRICLFDCASGGFIRALGSGGLADGQFGTGGPLAIAADVHGQLLVLCKRLVESRPTHKHGCTRVFMERRAAGRRVEDLKGHAA